MKQQVNEKYSISSILRYKQEDLYELILDIVPPKLSGSGYIILGRGNKPKPMLCVHLDTINTHSKQVALYIDDIEFDPTLKMLGLTSDSKASCLGGDDRAGVWIALNILDDFLTMSEWPYDIGFFNDEEIGCIGSSNYENVLKAGQCDNINTTCYIGLDRRSEKGRQEVATYGFDNEELLNMFTQQGYKHVYGSVTDASNLAGAAPCINLSVGYDNEHTRAEVLYVDCMQETLAVIRGTKFPGEYYEVTNIEDDIYDYYGNREDEYNSFYVYELEHENEILKETLEAMGVDTYELLKESGIVSTMPY